jgi:hypothetical protein
MGRRGFGFGFSRHRDTNGIILPSGPISFVGSAAQGGVGATGTWAFNMSSLRNAANVQPTLQEHDFVLVAQAVGMNGGDPPTTTPNPGSNLIRRLAFDANHTQSNAGLFVYHKFLGSSPDTQLTLPQSGHVDAGMGAAIYVFRGVHLLNPFDVADVTNALTGSNAPNPGSITPVTPGAWILGIGAGASGTAPTLTNPANMSATTNHFRTVNGADAVDAAVAVALKTDWASGAFDPGQFGGGTSDVSFSRCMATLALRPGPTP